MKDYFSFWFLLLPAGFPGPVLLLAPCFPWVGFIVCLCAPLLFSVWLPYSLWVSFTWRLSLPRLVGLFATVSSFGFHLLLSLAASSVPLFLLCSTLLFSVVLRSLGDLLCSFGLAPFSFLARWLLSPGSGFQLLLLGFPVGLPRVFLSCAIASFLPLGYSCFVGVHCVPCSSLLYILLVTLSFSVFSVLYFFYTSFRLSSSSYLLSLFGFVPFLLPRLPLMCLDVGSSGCVSSYGFVVGWASYFLVLCFGCFLFDFIRGFTSCFRFLGLFSSWRGFAEVW